MGGACRCRYALRVEPLLHLGHGAKEGEVRFSLDGSRLAIAAGHVVHVVSLEDGSTVPPQSQSHS